MRTSPLHRVLACVFTLATLGGVQSAGAAEHLCDAAAQNCRNELISLIRNERVRIDVAFWFMEDARYATEIVRRWQAGVPVRVMMDSDANASYPGNAPILLQLQAAGIPMREKTSGGILHRKFMLFAAQNMLEFSGANYSADAFVPVQPYVNYVDEAIYYTDDPVVVNTFKTVMDDMWTTTTGYRDYANITSPPTRVYPTYPLDPDLNFPPAQDYANRAVGRYKAETQQIDVQMYRITDRRHSDAMIAAFTRHVPVRLYTDTFEYRNVNRLWHSWNVDRMWLAGIPIKVPAHHGINHQKTVLLYAQGMTIFGSSNWTSASASSQAEHNYFTRKPWFFQWFADQFERKWNNTNPTGVAESAWFVPLPPDRPVPQSPANIAVGVAPNGQTLTWYGGPWAHSYDIYFGTDPLAQTLFAADQALGPSQWATQFQSLALPPLVPGTTYYWKVVSKTAALVGKTGPISSFTTAGVAPPPPPPPPDAPTVVIWASSGSAYGAWQSIVDASAAGGRALWNPNASKPKIAPAAASPANYVEATFPATRGTAYHLWVRMRAESNSVGNDSIHAQFSDAVDAGGFATMRIGTSSSAEVVLQAGATDPGVHNWGWADNGWNAPGPHLFFAATGTHTIRIQQREDGVIIDQIVLSPATYLNAPPGPRDYDATILARTATQGGPAATTAALTPDLAEVPLLAVTAPTPGRGRRSGRRRPRVRPRGGASPS
jgi:phosphatidylserine/phosphatidylglycerophosphate/cardiolipin synthase-like enzyme